MKLDDRLLSVGSELLRENLERSRTFASSKMSAFHHSAIALAGGRLTSFGDPIVSRWEKPASALSSSDFGDSTAPVDRTSRQGLDSIVCELSSSHSPSDHDLRARHFLMTAESAVRSLTSRCSRDLEAGPSPASGPDSRGLPPSRTSVQLDILSRTWRSLAGRFMSRLTRRCLHETSSGSGWATHPYCVVGLEGLTWPSSLGARIFVDFWNFQTVIADDRCGFEAR